MYVTVPVYFIFEAEADEDGLPSAAHGHQRHQRVLTLSEEDEKCIFAFLA